jgi:hypothetical protein
MYVRIIVSTLPLFQPGCQILDIAEVKDVASLDDPSVTYWRRKIGRGYPDATLTTLEATSQSSI